MKTHTASPLDVANAKIRHAREAEAEVTRLIGALLSAQTRAIDARRDAANAEAAAIAPDRRA